MEKKEMVAKFREIIDRPYSLENKAEFNELIMPIKHRPTPLRNHLDYAYLLAKTEYDVTKKIRTSQHDEKMRDSNAKKLFAAYGVPVKEEKEEAKTEPISTKRNEKPILFF